MRHVAHISDPHFGKSDPRLEEALLADLGEADLVVVSGDLTQRARVAQFEAARAFLARLPMPHLVVPGNHDVPLYDPIARLRRPLGRYREYITDELVPEHHDGELHVVGISTAHGLTTHHGRIDAEDLAAACARFAARPARWKIFVTHHPVVVAPDDEGHLVRGAEQALPLLALAGVEVLLSGHTHFAAAIRAAEGRMVAVHAGTCTSTRTCGEPNNYNRLAFEGDRLTITHRMWDGQRFIDGAAQRFERPGVIEVAADPLLARV
jgi:3',5'-cyclic AMP phosphodiesterase CpdA